MRCRHGFFLDLVSEVIPVGILSSAELALNVPLSETGAVVFLVAGAADTQEC